MKNRLVFFFFFFILLKTYAQSGASSCAALAPNPNAFQTCASNISFNSSTTIATEEFFPSCFGGDSFVAPSWFVFRIASSGPITLEISQTNAAGVGLDVDFALYGPFVNTTNLCNNITDANLVDCSYSTAAVEEVVLPNAIAGEMYILVIDNFAAWDGEFGPISVKQTGGVGATNCDFLLTVNLQNTDGTSISQFDYCKPETKQIVANVDLTNFNGLPGNLRFNYTWFKDNVQIGTPITNSLVSSNSITVVDSGDYKVNVSTYDIINNPNQTNPVPTVFTKNVSLKFHVVPKVSVIASSICLDANPILYSTINNSSEMNPVIDVLSYQWYRDNVLIAGATSVTYLPILPGNYHVRVFNLPCSFKDSNVITIIKKPDVSISNNQTFCAGGSYTIVSTNANSASNSSVTYQWYKDGVNTGITTANYVVNATNQSVNTTSVYYVIATEQTSCSQTSNSVQITINALPVVTTQPVLLEQCDYMNSTIDGVAETNLTQVYNSLTNNVPGLTLYFYLDAGLNTLINTPYDPTHYINSGSPFTQTIYVKAVNETVMPNCTSLSTGKINLIVNPTSIASYPSPSPACPQLNSTFGFFNFTAHRILIKNTYFSNSNVLITFHLTASDASTGSNNLTNASPIPVGTTVIHTRVVSMATNKCESIGVFSVVVKNPPIQTTIQNKSICLLDTYLLSSNDSEALLGQNPSVTASYFNSFADAENNSGAINKNSALQLSLGVKSYFVRLEDTVTNCFSVVSFSVKVFPNPIIVKPNPIKICGELSASFDLTSRINQITGGNANYQVTFYASNLDLLASNAIINHNSFVTASTVVYVKVVDFVNNSCTAVTTLDLVVLPSPGTGTNPTPLEICNDSGFDFFDLKSREIQMAAGAPLSTINFKYYINRNDAVLDNNNFIGSPEHFKNTIRTQQKIYIRLNSLINIDTESNVSCFSILELDLFVRPFPVSNLLNVPYVICVDQATNTVYPVEVKTALDPASYSFTWFTNSDALAGNEILGATNNSYITDVVGNYSVKVTNITNLALCASVFNFTTQKSLIPNTITPNPSELIAFAVDNTISVTVTPASTDYLYSIDGKYWQESNVFTNIPEGEFTITVLNKYGCGEDKTASIVVADFPRFFTPNGDGYFDTWNLKGVSALDEVKIFIFDRFGKLIKQIDPNGAGWDGTFNGKPVPATDYWFKLVYTKNNATNEFSSHFSLKR